MHTTVQVRCTVGIVFVLIDEQQILGQTQPYGTDREDPDCPMAEDTALYGTLLSYESITP